MVATRAYLDQPSFQQLRAIITEKTSPIYSWVGAGLSAEANVPGWEGLKNVMHSACERKMEAAEGDYQQELAARCNTVKVTQDYWEAFEQIKKILGQHTYYSEIANAIGKPQSDAVPRNYGLLWRFSQGMFTSNVDTLAERAHRKEHPDEYLHVFDGSSAGKHAHLLKSPERKLVHIHGRLNNPSSWVFTSTELDQLWSEANGYRNVVQSVLLSATVVFVGITVNDPSIAEHLRQLKIQGVESGSTFWITHRSEGVLEAEAEMLGVKIVRYRANSGDHSELTLLLSDLLKGKAEEKEPSPISPSLQHASADQILPPAELAAQKPEEIRQQLNAAALNIFSNSKGDYRKYKEFCMEYERAIHNSYYVAIGGDDSVFMGYQVIRQIDSRGAFGEVFEAMKDGERFAIKLMKKDVFARPGWLESFRRGATALQILTKREMQGAVRLIEAFELPTSIVMDYIDGPSVQAAVDARQLSTWAEVIEVAIQIASVIQDSHSLPERVLHRDLRPPNIMLEDFWVHRQIKVILLDFDLSWHRDATEASIVASSSSHGYLAPEQLNPDGKDTRDARVDSFGLGMTLYFMLTACTPEPNAQKAPDWTSKLISKIATHMPSITMHSVVPRMARLIAYATRNDQEERWTISQVLGEIKRLRDFLFAQGRSSIDLWTEELAARITYEYSWDPFLRKAAIHTESGAMLELRGDEAHESIMLVINWADDGSRNRKTVDKYLSKALPVIEKDLKISGWTDVRTSREVRAFGLEARLVVEQEAERFEEAARGLRAAREKLRVP